MPISDKLLDKKISYPRLTPGSIAKVFATDRPKHRGDRSEVPTAWLILLNGESRKRRVYAQIMSNSAYLYIKTEHGPISVEPALSERLYFKEEDQ